MFCNLLHKIRFIVAVMVVVSICMTGFTQSGIAKTTEPCHNSTAHEVSSSLDNQNKDFDDVTGNSTDQEKEHKKVSHCCQNHCCVTKVSEIQNYSYMHSLFNESAVFSYESVPPADFLYGIFRPPRLFV